MIESYLYSGGVFMLFLLAHTLYFHYKKPTDRWRTVRRFAEVFFIAYTIVFWSVPFFNTLSLLSDTGIAKTVAYINGVVLYVFLFFSYAQMYFLIDRSISARILTDIIEGGGSLTREEIRQSYSADALQQRRLDDMIYGGYLQQRDGRYVLTRKGKRNAIVFRWCKKYFHLYPGG